MALFAAGIYAAPRFTADYYKSDPASNLNKALTIYITKAKPSSFVEMKGYVAYLCFTAYKNELGGTAWVYVPESKSKTFGRNYGEVKSKITVNGQGESFPSKAAKVKMAELNGEYVFIYYYSQSARRSRIGPLGSMLIFHIIQKMVLTWRAFFGRLPKLLKMFFGRSVFNARWAAK